LVSHFLTLQKRCYVLLLTDARGECPLKRHKEYTYFFFFRSTETDCDSVAAKKRREDFLYTLSTMAYWRISLWLALFGLSVCNLFAQKDFGKWIVGLEASFDFAQYQAGSIPGLIPTVVTDVSLGRLSIGGGIGREYYRPYEYYTWTGRIVERMEGGRPVPYYVSTLRAFRPAYWSVPIRLQYRLHRCHCVFLHAGIAFDFFSNAPPEQVIFEGAELRQAPLQHIRRDQLFLPRTRSYEVGVGFNLLARDFFRLIARPSVVVSEDPEIYTDGPGRITTARMTFGVQMGLFR